MSEVAIAHASPGACACRELDRGTGSDFYLAPQSEPHQRCYYRLVKSLNE
jgi:hypothetical protein